MKAPVKLGLFGALLAVLLAGGAFAGAAVGPTTDDDDAGEEHGGEHATNIRSGAATNTALPGLSISSGGTTLVAETTTLAAGRAQPFRFSITDDSGAALTEFVPTHERDLHLIVASRDLATYAHVHPTLDAAGTWTAALPPLAPGSYRAFADFAAAGHEPATLGVDLAVPGRFEPAPLAPASRTAEVDGYRVELSGTAAAGTEATMALTITRDGAPVTDLEPYLGALGHLVTVRHGDLAYLHVHPLDEGETAGGPTVRFAVEVPTTGAYRMFFDFAHAGTVRTAAFTVDVAARDSGSHGHEDDG